MRQWIAERPFVACITTKHQFGTAPGEGKQSVFLAWNVALSNKNNFTV
jgi:hypothetical protein